MYKRIDVYKREDLLLFKNIPFSRENWQANDTVSQTLAMLPDALST